MVPRCFTSPASAIVIDAPSSLDAALSRHACAITMNYFRSFSTESVKSGKVQTEQMFSGLCFKADALTNLTNQAFSDKDRWSSPKVLESIRRKLGIANGVLNVLVAKVGLQSPGIVALVRQGEAT